MRLSRWTSISQSAFEWEREALDFLRKHLPDNEPWRAWSNFEFIDDDGRVNEVDAQVLTPAGLVLIEVKSRPSTLRGDAHSWTWTTEGRPVTTDNPLPLANRKAKRLASILRRHLARDATWDPPSYPMGGATYFPFRIRQRPVLDPGTEKRVALRGRPGDPDDAGIIGTLLHADESDWGGGVRSTSQQLGLYCAPSSRQVSAYPAAVAASATTNLGSSSGKGKTGRTLPPATPLRALRAACGSTLMLALPPRKLATASPGQQSARPASWKASSMPVSNASSITGKRNSAQPLSSSTTQRASPRPLLRPAARATYSPPTPRADPATRGSHGLRPWQATLSPRPGAAEVSCARSRAKTHACR